MDNENYIAKCISGISIPPISNISGPLSFVPISLGSISVDISEFCNPKILITFSGSISGAVTGVGTIGFTEQIFRVVRICNGVRTQVSGNLGGGSLTLLNTEAFSYQVCDCNCSCTPCDCLTYTIELLPGIIASFTTITINNIAISGFVAEKDSQKFNCEKGNTIAVATSLLTPTTTVSPFDIGSVSIDTCKLCDPKVLVTFSGDIAAIATLTGITPTAQLLSHFRVLRTCNGVSMELPFSFSALSVAFTLEPNVTFRSEGFSYQFCDDDLSCCNDCITYTVQFVPDAPIPTAIFIGIANVVVSAFTLEQY